MGGEQVQHGMLVLFEPGIELRHDHGRLPLEARRNGRRHRHADHGLAARCAQAHADLLDLAIEHWPYELLAPRAWQLRPSLPTYDASYVALAELLGVALVTLDRGVSRVPDLRCTVATPQGNLPGDSQTGTTSTRFATPTRSAGLRV